jgi:hypothetical protein
MPVATRGGGLEPALLSIEAVHDREAVLDETGEGPVHRRDADLDASYAKLRRELLRGHCSRPREERLDDERARCGNPETGLLQVPERPFERS